MIQTFLEICQRHLGHYLRACTVSLRKNLPTCRILRNVTEINQEKIYGTYLQ
jgi:hypothetical protein